MDVSFPKWRFNFDRFIEALAKTSKQTAHCGWSTFSIKPYSNYASKYFHFLLAMIVTSKKTEQLIKLIVHGQKSVTVSGLVAGAPKYFI